MNENAAEWQFIKPPASNGYYQKRFGELTARVYWLGDSYEYCWRVYRSEDRYLVAIDGANNLPSTEAGQGAVEQYINSQPVQP